MMPDDNATPSVWSELRAQRDLLIEMKTKLERVEDHEVRIRRLEERKFPLPTIAVLISFCALILSVVIYVSV